MRISDWSSDVCSSDLSAAGADPKTADGDIRPGFDFKAKGHVMAKNTICLWYDKDAEAAARFYADTFPDSAVGAVHRAPSDYPSGTAGDVLTVAFTVAGVPCIAFNRGPTFKHHEPFAFSHTTAEHPETASKRNAHRGQG